jgi:hypothetical protein
LSFEIDRDPDTAQECTIGMTACFRPRGLMGIAYWYAMLPFHAIVFRRMLRRLACEAGVHEPGSRGVFGKNPPSPAG